MPALAAAAVAARVALARLRLLAAAAAARLRTLAPRDARADAAADRAPCTRVHGWWTGEQAPPPLPPLPVSAKILRISGRGNCKEAIFALENGIFRRGVLRIHAPLNSAWSYHCARRLACGTPCFIGLTSRCFAHRARASCAPAVHAAGDDFNARGLRSTIHNGRLASSHRAVFGGPVFRPCGLRFALCPRGSSRFAASDFAPCRLRRPGVPPLSCSPRGF